MSCKGPEKENYNVATRKTKNSPLRRAGVTTVKVCKVISAKWGVKWSPGVVQEGKLGKKG